MYYMYPRLKGQHYYIVMACAKHKHGEVSYERRRVALCTALEEISLFTESTSPPAPPAAQFNNPDLHLSSTITLQCTSNLCALLLGTM